MTKKIIRYPDTSNVTSLSIFRRITRHPVPFDVSSPGTSETNDITLFSDNTGQVIKTSGVKMVNSVIIDPVTVDQCIVTSLSDYEQTIAISGGELTIDIIMGQSVYFDHDVDCTINITDVPANANAFVYLRRKKDSTTTARLIDWDGSPANFRFSGGVEPTLSQEPDAFDKIILETNDGGITWDVALRAADVKPS